MDKWDIELTKQFRMRDNVEQVSATIGEIIQVEPEVLISIYGGKTILNNKLYYLCSRLLDSKENIILDNVADHGAISTSCTITNILNVGDKVLCLPNAELSTFFIIDKVVI